MSQLQGKIFVLFMVILFCSCEPKEIRTPREILIDSQKKTRDSLELLFIEEYHLEDIIDSCVRYIYLYSFDGKFENYKDLTVGECEISLTDVVTVDSETLELTFSPEHSDTLVRGWLVEDGIICCFQVNEVSKKLKKISFDELTSMQDVHHFAELLVDTMRLRKYSEEKSSSLHPDFKRLVNWKQ
jgi:hypothetical protein